MLDAFKASKLKKAKKQILYNRYEEFEEQKVKMYTRQYPWCQQNQFIIIMIII